MLKTFTLNRPHMIFDAANQKHRSAYYRYLQSASWVDCPYQFVVEEPYIDLPHCINQKMIKYYMGREFSKNKNKIQIK
jgi:hypothetical protein